MFITTPPGPTSPPKHCPTQSLTGTSSKAVDKEQPRLQPYSALESGAPREFRVTLTRGREETDPDERNTSRACREMSYPIGSIGSKINWNMREISSTFEGEGFSNCDSHITQRPVTNRRTDNRKCSNCGLQEKHWLLFQKTQDHFPAPTWRTTTVCNSSLRASRTLFWSLWLPEAHRVCRHSGAEHTARWYNVSWMSGFKVLCKE